MEGETENTSKFRGKFHQVIATLSVTCGSFGLGSLLGWTSPGLPSLSEDFGDISANEASWIASIAILGALFSGPAAGFLLPKLGRRGLMITASIPFTISWLVTAGAKWNHNLIYVGRLIGGISGGIFTVAIPVYVSEIAEEGLRGILGSLMVFMLVAGILYSYVIGSLVAWWALSLFCAIPTVTLFFTALFIPESPKYLLSKGRNSDAEKAFRWFRGLSDKDAMNQELFDTVTTDRSFTQNQERSWKDALKSKWIVKPALTCIILICFQQFGGINAATMYTVDIFKSASDDVNANLACISIGIVQVVFVTLSVMLVDRLGRKPILIVSSVLMSSSLFVLGGFFFLKEQNNEIITEDMKWIPMITLMMFIIAYSFGVGPVPWLLVSELLNPEFKSELSALVTFVYWITAFLATKTFQDMIFLFRESGCYWIFGSVCIGTSIFTYFCVPETKGRNSITIRQYFGDPLENQNVNHASSSMI